MARYNEILAGRYNRFLQKLFSMKGGPPAPQLASEVMIVFPFFNGVENREIEGWKRFGIHGNLPASAGNNNGFRLRNPAGSNVICIVEKWVISTTVADLGILGINGNTTVDFTTIFSGGRIDGRDNPATAVTPTSTTIASGQAAAPASQTTLVVYNTLALTSIDMILTDEQELTLLPGDALSVLTNGINLGLRNSVIIRERALEESERT